MCGCKLAVLLLLLYRAACSSIRTTTRASIRSWSAASIVSFSASIQARGVQAVYSALGRPLADAEAGTVVGRLRDFVHTAKRSPESDELLELLDAVRRRQSWKQRIHPQSSTRSTP